MKTILDILMLLCVLVWIYTFYQISRNNKIHKIRTNWVYTNDSRRYNYTYDEMFDPSKKNWYGLRYPQDKHFKK